MILAASLLLGVLVLLILAQAIASRRFVALARRMAARLTEGSVTQTAALPDQVRQFAVRNGAMPAGALRAVEITQDAELQLSPDQPFWAAPATQTIALGAPGFVWFAETPGPLVPRVRVIDAFVEGEGRLIARLFGSIPVANASGADVTQAEAMRYLAELPWVPDAILGNPDVQWAVRDDGWIEARLPDYGATVRFRLEAGDIVEMRADARPARDPDGTTTLRDWRAVFSDYAELGGRRIPTRGEVGYVLDGVYAPYWRGHITGYRLLPEPDEQITAES